MATLDPSEIMFTPFEPKTKNRFIMYIEGVPAYLIKTANRPQIQFEGKIVGLPVQSPWVDVRSIGAGGGSIAYLDDGGLIRSGPQSSGAVR